MRRHSTAMAAVADCAPAALDTDEQNQLEKTLRARVVGFDAQIARSVEAIRNSRALICRIDALIEKCRRFRS